MTDVLLPITYDTDFAVYNSDLQNIIRIIFCRSLGKFLYYIAADIVLVRVVMRRNKIR